MSTPALVHAWFEHEKTRIAIKSKDKKRLLDLTIYDAFDEHNGFDLEFVEGKNKLGPAFVLSLFDSVAELSETSGERAVSAG